MDEGVLKGCAGREKRGVEGNGRVDGRGAGCGVSVVGKPRGADGGDNLAPLVFLLFVREVAG